MEKITRKVIKNLCSPLQEEMNRSFNIIFDKYRYLVYYVSFDILKNEEESKDIVNDTFIKMYERRGSFLNESKLKYFLLTTARNLSINRYNQLKDRLSYSDDIKGEEDNSSASLYLDEFKNILDKEEYNYLVLHIICGFSFREIASSKSLTTSQVSSKYQRGIAKLREYYGGSYK